jgi:hypothetical protein
MAKKLGDLVATIFHQKHDWKIALLRSWPTIVGPLGPKIRLEKITDTAIVLGVQDSCWLQELYLLSPVLLKTINKTLDAPRIKTLRFIVADMTAKNKKSSMISSSSRQRTSSHLFLKTRCLSPVEQAALAKITDQELQHALTQFLLRCYQERGS